MEYDSIHSTIERKIKGKEIYCPKDYVKGSLKARRKTTPYHEEYIEDFGAVQFFDSIRPESQVYANL